MYVLKNKGETHKEYNSVTKKVNHVGYMAMVEEPSIIQFRRISMQEESPSIT